MHHWLPSGNVRSVLMFCSGFRARISLEGELYLTGVPLGE
jgi:hypothetical protein